MGARAQGWASFSLAASLRGRYNLTPISQMKAWRHGENMSSAPQHQALRSLSSDFGTHLQVQNTACDDINVKAINTFIGQRA